MNPLVRYLHQHIGERGQLGCDLGQRAKSQNVADHDSENLPAAEAGQFQRGRQTGRKSGVQARAQLLRRNHALQVYRIQELLGPIRMFENFLGQKPAMGEDRHHVAQSGGRAGEPIERGGMLLAKPGEIVQALLRRGRCCQKKVEAVPHGEREKRRQSRNLAPGARRVPIGGA